jgi:hypothetical protein
MKLPQLHRSALFAIAALFLAAAFVAPTPAQMRMPAGVKNVVLVHGAWADGSS